MATKKDPEQIEDKAAKEEAIPTPAEAKQMFKDRPDLACVLTTEGFKSRYD